jgi:hypothetical protein
LDAVANSGIAVGFDANRVRSATCGDAPADEAVAKGRDPELLAISLCVERDEP